MSDELDLTMEALEELYRSRRDQGWDLKVYDYSSNTWREAEEAFTTPGAYERAVLTGPDDRPVRVRVLPPGAIGVHVNAASAGRVAVWRALGIDLQGRHLDVIAALLDGRTGPVTVEEIASLLEGEAGEAVGEAAREARLALEPLLRHGGGRR